MSTDDLEQICDSFGRACKEQTVALMDIFPTLRNWKHPVPEM